jgi:hypothetical protein
LFKRLISLLLITSLVVSMFSVVAMAKESSIVNANITELSQNQKIEKEFANNQEQIKKDIEYSKKTMSQKNKIVTKTTVASVADPGFLASMRGTYSIPYVGLVVITITGAIIIGGVVIDAGTWLYNKICDWIEAWQITQISKKIPSKLLIDSKTVDLTKFTKKVPNNGGPPKWQDIITQWYIVKDQASGGQGHGGSFWKLLDWAGKRIASLTSDGKILRD